MYNLERMAIVAEDGKQLLNYRRDIFNNCVHNRRFFFKQHLKLTAFSSFIYFLRDSYTKILYTLIFFTLYILS